MVVGGSPAFLGSEHVLSGCATLDIPKLLFRNIVISVKCQTVPEGHEIILFTHALPNLAVGRSVWHVDHYHIKVLFSLILSKADSFLNALNPFPKVDKLFWMCLSEFWCQLGDTTGSYIRLATNSSGSLDDFLASSILSISSYQPFDDTWASTRFQTRKLCSKIAGRKESVPK